MKVKHKDQNKFWNALYGVLVDNLLISIYVLHNNFGFGEERVGRYIDATIEAAKLFEEWAADDVMDLNTEEGRKKYCEKHREFLKSATVGYLPENFRAEILEERTPTHAEINIKYKNESKKSAITFSEAAELQTKMQAFGDFLKDKEASKNVHNGNDNNMRRIVRAADPADGAKF